MKTSGLDTDHPVGLHKGPVVAENSCRKASVLICFVLYFTVIFALFEYWAEEESLPFFIRLSQLHSWPFPVNEFWSGGLLIPTSVSSHICKYCKQTPLLKIGPTKGVAKWVYVKTFLCNSVLSPLSGVEIRERINHECSYYKWTFQSFTPTFKGKNLWSQFIFLCVMADSTHIYLLRQNELKMISRYRVKIYV